MLFEHSTHGLHANSHCELEDDFRVGNNENEASSLDESGYREKRIQHSADVEELIRALGGLNLERDYWLQTAARVKSADLTERYEGTKQFRMMLSVSGDIPIQAVIDTGVVPRLVQFISEDEDTALQFEAAWALTNIASGTGPQTEVSIRHYTSTHAFRNSSCMLTALLS